MSSDHLLHFCPFIASKVSTEDLAKYNTLAQQQAKKLFPSFNMSKFYAAENADPLVFCHFAENIQDQIYDQVGRTFGSSSSMESESDDSRDCLPFCLRGRSFEIMFNTVN